MRPRINSKFKLTPDAIENYGDHYAGRTFTVKAVYTHYCSVQDMHRDPTGSPGYDTCAGSYLYGSDLPFDVYDWEMVTL